MALKFPESIVIEKLTQHPTKRNTIVKLKLELKQLGNRSQESAEQADLLEVNIGHTLNPGLPIVTM